MPVIIKLVNLQIGHRSASSSDFCLCYDIPMQYFAMENKRITLPVNHFAEIIGFNKKFIACQSHKNPGHGCKMVGISSVVTYLLGLHFEEYLLLVEEVQEKPAQENVARGINHLSPLFGYQAYDTGEEELVGETEIDDFLRKIYGDGIHAHHCKGEGPLAVSAHVNDPIEDGEHPNAVAACEHYES